MGDGYLCPNCKVPVCRTCGLKMEDNEIGPEMLINDTWLSYIQEGLHLHDASDLDGEDGD